MFQRSFPPDHIRGLWTSTSYSPSHHPLNILKFKIAEHGSGLLLPMAQTLWGFLNLDDQSYHLPKFYALSFFIEILKSWSWQKYWALSGTALAPSLGFFLRSSPSQSHLPSTAQPASVHCILRQEGLAGLVGTSQQGWMEAFAFWGLLSQTTGIPSLSWYLWLLHFSSFLAGPELPH